jgi:hypothetical protein
MSEIVVELAPFTLAEGADETALMHASEALQSGFLSTQPGFIRRDLLKGPDRQWIDLVYWESREAAERAMANAANSPVCFQYFQLMAGVEHSDPGGGVSLLGLRRTYTR